MPWAHCGRQLPDDVPCPTCGQRKPSWTLRLNQTRVFALGKRSDGDDAAQVAVLEEAARGGVPFCEKCARAAAARPDGRSSEAEDEVDREARAREADRREAGALELAARDGSSRCERAS
jgi:hypothetical protein